MVRKTHLSIFFGFGIILAPLMATLAVALSGDILSSLPIYTTVFMKALSGFLLKFFPIFLLGAVFGQLMADSGAGGDGSRWLRHATA